VIVDDGSTDPATVALLDGYHRPKTRVVRSEHRGLAAARNIALRHARGRYVTALDADDRLDPTFLEKTLAVLEGDPSLAFASCWLRTFGDEDWVWRQESCEFPALLAECTVATCALVRREALDAVGAYDEAMISEDWELWIRLVERGYRGTILPEVLFHYRRRPASLSRYLAEPAVHMAILRQIVGAHRPSFDRHAFGVLVEKEAELLELSRGNSALEQDIETRLRPEVARRRARLAELIAHRTIAGPAAAGRARVQSVEAEALAAARGDGERLALELARERDRAAALRAALAAAHQEADAARGQASAVRESASWRLTGPLRIAHSLWLRLTAATPEEPTS
jgi:hypothetical protein